MKNPALGFILLILLVSCTSQSPLTPDPVVSSDPTVEMPEAREPSRSPLSPAQARTALSERGVPYSQRSFLAAAGEGNLEVVRLFIEAGMAPDAQTEDEGYDTALMRAAGGGHLAIVKYLISQGAYLHAQSRYCAGNIAVQVDIELNPQVPTCNRPDALMWAAWGGNMEVVEYLLEEGAKWRDMSWPSPRKGPQSAIQLAAYAGHADVVRLLLEHVTYINGLGYRMINGGGPAMGWAASQGHLDVVRILFGHGVKLNPASTLGQRGTGITALMRAAERGHADVVRFLLDNGADLFVMQGREWMDEDGNIFRELGDCALALAISHDHSEVIQVLLNHWVYTHGADSRDDLGRTTLMYAAAWGNVEVMQEMVNNDAPIQAKTTHTGFTALMFAAANGHTEAVKLLLDLGADPTAQNSYEHTALSLAQLQGHTQIAELLEGQ